MNAYPLRLEGKLDAPLSRWLWLVRFTGRYPPFRLDIGEGAPGPDTGPVPVAGPDPAPGLS